MEEETTEIIENDEVSEDEINEEEVSEVEESEDEPKQEEPEPWMLEEDENDKPTKFLKAKKRLKGQIEAKDLEIEKLRAEIEAVKQQRPTPQTGQLKRPIEFDYETTEEYHAALDEYEAKKYAAIQQTEAQQRMAQQAERETADSVDRHYQRAEALIDGGLVSQENYIGADTVVRNAFEAIAPTMGNRIVDQFIKTMGEGSEKVMYHLGRNKQALAELQAIMQTDATGLQAAVYLGKKLEHLTNPNRRKSTAPSPAPEPTGDAAGATGSALKRKYKAARKAGDTQAAFSLRRQAKKSGVDVSDW